MRALLAILRQPTLRRRYILTTRLLWMEAFRLALVVESVEDDSGVPTVSLRASAAKGLDLDAVGETLNSRLSPLLGVGVDAPRWINLHDDPFGRGSGFLRKFNLSTALILPLHTPPANRPSTHLLIASQEPIRYQDAAVQQILVAWAIYRTISDPAWQRPDAVERSSEAAVWPGMAAWNEAPVALALVARDEVLAANQAAEELLRAAVGTEGHSWRLWLAAAVRRLEAAQRTQEKLHASKQRKRTLEVILGPVLKPDESRLVAIRDATDEVLADSRQAEAVRTLSHELRTPLTSMKNSVGLLVRGEAGTLSPEQERFLALTMRNIDRLERLVSDLLDVSQAEAGHLALRRQLVDLGVLLREALEMLAATAQQRGVTLDYAGLPSSFPAHVDGDKVVQMIHNTVGNALKYTEESGYVRLWLRGQDETLPEITRFLAERFFLPLRAFAILIEDNGMGMNEEVLRNLFRPFRRGQKAEAAHVPGSGLGLHITRALVEAHGGIIRLASSPDVGTTVQITLPRDPESELVMAASRRLERALHSCRPGTQLAVLDTRRPDREIDERDSARAEQTVRAFLERLADEVGGMLSEVPSAIDGPVQSDSAPASGTTTLLTLSVGLWLAVREDWSRLQAAWEVEKVKPGCPVLLQDSHWELLTPPPLCEPGDPENAHVTLETDAGSVVSGITEESPWKTR